ncbi:MAG: DUF885 domain-containing protein [Taibaiella sp.]|nr:DUF885 domain-containing protein [Taibaiella sp.]
MSLTSFGLPVGDEDARFEEFKKTYLEEMWRTYPTWASSIGYHKYDNTLVVPDDESRRVELAFSQNLMMALTHFELAKLSTANKTDYHMMENQLKSTQWAVKDLRAWEWDPTTYNLSGTFAEMLNNDYEPLDNRLRNFSQRMSYIPAYYEAAKRNIKNPTKEHTELAIEQINGGLSVFEMDLGEAVGKSGLTNDERAAIKKRAAESIAAIKAFTKWLKELDNKTPRSFRLGKDLYEMKFAYDLQSGFTAAQIYERALARKKELHGKMYEVTTQLWSKYYKTAMPEDTFAAISQMINRLSEEHVKPGDFQSAIEKQIPELIAFIKRKDLLYIDPSKPLVVRREPAYMAGVAGASISAPGPYDKEGNTYYNVGSLDGWDSAKAESYLREYNKYILQILNIHEAIPGHYTQLVYANQSPSLIKSVLGNNAMIEGWAVYTELMMLENGYGARPMAPTQDAPAEMWLMYYKWNLRSTCNTILDYSVHAGNMDKAQAMKLLVNEAFQQQAEAEGKWRRVSVTQVQLCCYFTGFTEICALREEVKKKEGTKFSLKKFHERFLSYGSAPVKYIREMMLN